MRDIATVWVAEQFPNREPENKNLTFYLEGDRKSLVILSFDDAERMGVSWWAGKSDSDSGGLRGRVNLEKPDRETIRFLERFLVSGRRKVLRAKEKHALLA